ncbi:MAG TPA: glycosyltransferase family 4 protein [Rhizomicrobium sp.]|nr:glycosyltransferase family 4 protein [Rhizomicrobium sp.]
MAPPRILLVSHSLTRTGAPRVLVDMANWLNGHGWSVIVVNVNTAAQAPLAADLAPEICYWPMPQFAVSNKLWHRALNWLLGGRQRLKFIARILDEVRPDIVMINTVFHLDINDLVMARGMICVRYLLEAERYFHQLPDADTGRLMDPRLHIITVDEDLARFIRNFFQQRIDLVALPPAPLTRVDNLPAKEPPYQVLGMAAAGLTKGFDLFCAVADKVLSTRQDAVFIYVGPTDDKEFLEIGLRRVREENRDRLIVTGFVPDVKPYFENAALFLYPVRQDPYPIVGLWALAYGMPVVGFHNCFMEDVVACNAGDKIPCYDLDTFAAAVNKRLDMLANGTTQPIDASPILDNVQPERIKTKMEAYLRSLLPQ